MGRTCRAGRYLGKDTVVGRAMSRPTRTRLAIVAGLSLALSGVALDGWAQQPPTAPQDAEQAEQPVIVPPRLVHFQEAKYPEQAFAAGLEAEVVLKLVIAADGSVSEVEVLQPVGHGFDEAAAAAAKQFIFTPAQRDGQPVPVAIKYAYRFTAQMVETPDEELPPVTTGNLEGQILIAGSEVAVAGALVTVVPRAATGPSSDAAGAAPEDEDSAAAGVGYQVRTDVEGRWELPELAPGQYRIEVRSEGFETATTVEDVVAGEATALILRISEASEGIEIIVQGERPPREVTRRTLQRREISRVPGTGGDALRSIQSLPGVARPPGLAGLLIVRGSAPQDTNYFIDGALVPLVYHFGGLSSVIPTELLDKIDFYPGNFSAKYGRVTGGIVDVAMRSPDTECRDRLGAPTGEKDCFHGLAQVDLIDGRMLLQGPLGDDWSFAVAGRRSWVDAWLKPVLEEAGAGVTTAPVYFDYQAIVEHRPSPKSRFRAQLYGSDDALEILINNPSAQEPAFGGQLGFGTAFWRIQAIYEQQLTRDWDLYSTLAVGRDRLRFGLGAFRFDLDSYPIELRSELGWKIAPGIKLNGGLDFITVPVDVFVRAPPPPRPGEPDPGPFTSRPVLESETTTTAFRPSWYLEGEVQAGERLLLVPGARLDYALDSGHPDLNPRLNARYTLIGTESDQDDSETRVRKTVLKGGVGQYSQPPQFQETDTVFGTPGVRSNDSLHVVLGVEQELTDQIDVSVEGYYKDLYNFVSRTPALDGNRFVYGNDASGSVVGAEALVKYKADERFFGWIAYTLSRSLRRNLPDEPEYLFQFDQTHNLTVLGSYRMGDGWEMGARYRIISGSMTTPVAAALYAADAGSYTPLQGAPFSRRLPLFHQLDLRVEKNWVFDAWRLMAYLDVWNAYNNAAVEAIQYNFDFSQSVAQTGLPIIPSLGLRGEF